jgi:DNA modification methylase
VIEINKTYNENCLDTLKKIDDNTIDLVLTSPPYDNMRIYGANKNYQSNTNYSFDFESIALELIRAIKSGGVIMWNVQDQTIKGSRTGNSMKQALFFMNNGLRLHDHLIWVKSGTPFPSQYRYRNVWENMFIFSKGKQKTFNPIQKKNKTAGAIRYSRQYRNRNGEFVRGFNGIPIKEYGNEDNVWYISNKNSSEHPAIMTEEIARRHIISWTDEGELVYDPFMGSGTTGRIAKELNRNYIGSEININYIELYNYERRY